jgi:hypothetical protein
MLVVSMTLFAQDEKPTAKGNMMAGGSGSFGYGFDILESSSGHINFSLHPTVGFFLSDGFALGASPLFSIYSRLGNTDYSSVSFGLGIFLAKYFNIGIFIKGLVGYDLARTSYSSAGYSNANITHSVQFIPEVGYAFFLGPNVALELSLYNRLELQPAETASLLSDTYISAGFQVFL